MYSLRVRRIVLQGTVRTHVAWRSFPGSVLHGVLGRALFDASCVFPEPRCTGCELLPNCSYGNLVGGSGRAGNQHADAIPRPIRLHVDPWHLPGARPGESITVTVSLFGASGIFAPIVQASLERAAAEGLGRALGNDGRGTIDLRLLQDSTSVLAFSGALEDVGPPPLPRSVLRFSSPVRLVEGGKVASSPTLRTLVAATLRRFSGLLRHAEGIEPVFDAASIVRSAAEVPDSSKWNRIPIRRFSSRQRSEIRIDGLLGEFPIPDEAIRFLPILALAPEMGLGKGTAMGFGECALVPASSPGEGANRWTTTES